MGSNKRSMELSARHVLWRVSTLVALAISLLLLVLALALSLWTCRLSFMSDPQHSDTFIASTSAAECMGLLGTPAAMRAYQDDLRANFVDRLDLSFLLHSCQALAAASTICFVLLVAAVVCVGVSLCLLTCFFFVMWPQHLEGLPRRIAAILLWTGIFCTVLGGIVFSGFLPRTRYALIQQSTGVAYTYNYAKVFAVSWSFYLLMGAVITLSLTLTFLWMSSDRKSIVLSRHPQR